MKSRRSEKNEDAVWEIKECNAAGLKEGIADYQTYLWIPVDK
jgi:hypothetical protein